MIAYACDLLPLYVTAVAYEESLYAGENVTPEEMAEYVAEHAHATSRRCPPERFPNVVALAAALTAGTGDERFEFGLEVLVRGLAAMASRRRVSWIVDVLAGSPTRQPDSSRITTTDLVALHHAEALGDHLARGSDIRGSAPSLKVRRTAGR